MKGNDGTGNIEERDNWETPQWLFDKLNNQYEFILDCCATSKNSKCPKFCIDFLDSQLNWQGTSAKFWMNPPFSKAYEMFMHFFKHVKKGVAIYRCDNMETRIWQDIILKNATWVFIPRCRLNYEGKEGKGSRFPSALIGYNVEDPILEDVEGYILHIRSK